MKNRAPKNGQTDEPGQSSEGGIVIKGKQSNHCEYVLPDGMHPWADEPLYLVIARWCLLQGGWINRNDIARAFRLPERRASYQLSYISRKKNRVVCRTRMNNSGELKHSCNEIWIDRILPELPGEVREPEVRRHRVPSRPAGVSSRRVGSGMSGNIQLWDNLLKAVRGGKKDE
ncbi:CaiF/GrlA family transcriptional regulator [Salmonella enterica]|nr:CaiF/GrlA family transcriptional regulator [Salmonella enterica subsp. enterica serovar Carrau]EIG1272155.1 CaiF/GrlA family transcriptional regulator [Salmonella enterica]HCM4642000.1 CaiF/GrlA family transcriptional regulator [Salmonella enterica subsp. enterica serovar Panama]EJJ0394083.1 CaiF/GrlA family transcriptional regulator [Salmonella enterica]EJJ3987011.1 CaiF/GrlA family transcriptional regulator [Salmonella enterica]